MEEQVIIVDELDRELGIEGKLAAHRSGVLHRAFSIFVRDRTGRILLQQRALGKYHSGGLWSNTCCGHPRPGEPIAEAARRRLGEEMGFACPIERLGTFTYRAELDGGLIEHELDHVFVGLFDGTPVPDPSEVAGWRWVEAGALAADLEESPTRYTAWLGPALQIVRAHTR